MTRYINRLFLVVCILSSESQIWSQEIFTDDPFETTVGMSQTLSEIILPGSELEVTDIEDQQPFVLRITKSFVHGDAFRYHFVYYGLEPGEYNLTDYLQRKDGSERGDLPEQIITVQAVLPPGQVTPNQLTLPQAPSIGGYRLLLALAGVVWVVGLLLLIRSTRRPRSDQQASTDRPRSLADQLQPLLEAAAAGSLAESQRAELERLLLAFWRKKLGVTGRSPAEAMTALKADPEAGELLRQLEDWLHNPNPSAPVDLKRLLKPYTNVTAQNVSS